MWHLQKDSAPANATNRRTPSQVHQIHPTRPCRYPVCPTNKRKPAQNISQTSTRSCKQVFIRPPPPLLPSRCRKKKSTPGDRNKKEQEPRASRNKTKRTQIKRKRRRKMHNKRRATTSGRSLRETTKRDVGGVSKRQASEGKTPCVLAANPAPASCAPSPNLYFRPSSQPSWQRPVRFSHEQRRYTTPSVSLPPSFLNA